MSDTATMAVSSIRRPAWWVAETGQDARSTYQAGSLSYAIALLFLGVAVTQGAILEEKSEQVHPISATARITIRNTDGRIFIFGSDASELRITTLKRAFSKERLDGIRINVAIHGEEVAIDTTYPPAPERSVLADRSGTVDYLILAPQTCALAKVELARGEILIEGMRGAGLDAQLAIGRILIRDCFTPTRLSLGQGGMDLFYNWWEPATAFSVEAAIANGDLRVGFPEDAALRLDASSVHGQISNELSDRKTDDRRMLRWTIGAEPRANFQLRTTRGSIRIEKAY